MVIKKSAYLNRLACKSFYVKILRDYFNISYIIKGFVVAFCLSIFIYLEYFHISAKFLDTFFAILGFYLLLKANKQSWFWSGFFIGIFWFYWISLSFRYYGLTYMIPLIILSIALVYAFIFRIIAFKNIYIRAILLFSLSFMAPFGFNWLKLELTLINSYFNTNELFYATFLLGIVLLVKLTKYYKIFAIILLLICAYPLHDELTRSTLHISIAQTDINQSDRWNKKYENSIIMKDFYLIQKAISNKYDLIILPESAFPQYLNLHLDEMNILKKLSYKIDIVTGGLTYKNDKFYNSSYFFQKGIVQIANKVTLVPFGEEIPLPAFLSKFINNIFFDSASDFSRAKNTSDFVIKGVKFRSAICFEATTDKLFLRNPKRMIAISNNAWFKPSIEPTLQHLLLRLYARKYDTTIYHSANGGISGVIEP